MNLPARARQLKNAAFAALLFVAIPATASAQVLYDNGAPNNSGTAMQNNWTTGGAPIGMGWSTANDFTLGQTSTLGYLNWYALFLGENGPSPVSASYYWQILSNDAGRPGSVIAGGNVNTQGVETNFGCCYPLPFEYQSYRFYSSLGNLTLGAGTYWLAIGNFTSNWGSEGGAQYFWSNSLDGYGNETKRWDNGTWKTIEVEGSFSLHGTSNTSTVPEPASLALLATGLGGLGFFRRRKTKQ